MLRACIYNECRNLHVSATCHPKLSPQIAGRIHTRRLLAICTLNSTGENPRSRWSQTTVSSASRRSLSSSDSLQKSDEGANVESFPGTKVSGRIGAFAARSSDQPRASLVKDGLLPHERQARSESASATAFSRSDISRSVRQGSVGSGQHTGHVSVNKQHPAESQSPLLDVFRSLKEPTRPSMPESWSSNAGKSSASDARPERQQTTVGRLRRSRDDSKPRNRDSKSNEDRFHHKSASLRSHSSNDKSPTNHIPARRSRPSPTGVQRSRTLGQALQSDSHESGLSAFDRIAKDHRVTNDSSGAKSGVHAEGSFWDELETRASQSKSSVISSTPRRTQQGPRANDGVHRPSWAYQSSTTDSSVTTTDTARGKRLSRFEREAEDPKTKRKQKRSNQINREGRGYKNSQEKYDNDWNEEAADRWEEKQRRKKERQRLEAEALQSSVAPVPIRIPEYINVSSLGEALARKPAVFVAELEEMGFENITVDTIMTGETGALIAQEYGFEPTVHVGSDRDIVARPPAEDMSSLPPRPPVVTIMGHVDHGKTTLLDWLRKASVAAQEHGGITQHIGAFIVNMSSGKSITFLDTPGHAAFLSMRQRGANATDIVVLVVAADDSVMPQTLEALKHATAAKVPIIVAITKVDKEAAQIGQVKADLSRHGVEIEDYGGDVQVVCVSGKTGQGMEDLEESIVTLSEVLDVRAETDGMAEGYVLESSVKQDGKVATVLIKRGTLRVGDFIVAGRSWAKVRLLRNEAGAEIDEAPPGTPAEILGWRNLPEAGEQVLQAEGEDAARVAVEYRDEMASREKSSAQLSEQEQRAREKAAADEAKKAAEDSQLNRAAGTNAKAEVVASQDVQPSGPLNQNFIVKGDVLGSVEAVCGSVMELGNHEISPKILRSVVGAISEYDIDHAATSGSIIINFNNPIQPQMRHQAEEAKVRILDHSVIYHVIDDVKEVLSDRLPPLVTQKVNGEADVVQVFSINVKKRITRNIAGCKVRNGAIKKNSLVRVLRNGEIIYSGKIDTLKHVKKDVQEMGKNTECGIGMEDFEDLHEGDQIQTYEEISQKRHL